MLGASKKRSASTLQPVEPDMHMHKCTVSRYRDLAMNQLKANANAQEGFVSRQIMSRYALISLYTLIQHTSNSPPTFLQ